MASYQRKHLGFFGFHLDIRGVNLLDVDWTLGTRKLAKKIQKGCWK